MVGWHHRLNGNEFKQALGVREGQGSLAFCSQWSCKESDMTEQLKNNLLFRCSVNPDQGLAFTPQWEFLSSQSCLRERDPFPLLCSVPFSRRHGGNDTFSVC